MPDTDEQTSRHVAEAARETDWKDAAFLRDLFLGSFRLDLVHPYPEEPRPRPGFQRFYDGLRRFLLDEVDPIAIDESGRYPDEVIDGLAALGAFGMIIPEKYGGLGLTQREYGKAMMLVGSCDANVAALLSAHQSIGVPRPLLLFGTEEQKLKFLPRCARGTISAFALTEPGVGSDPASLATTAEPTPDGEFYVLNGTKLWCTNGTLAELVVVMARTPGDHSLSAFVVDMGWKGVHVTRRCRFMGLKALGNGQLDFRDVRVPRENLIGEEGRGLKIALATLNSGRLALPAAVTGGAKMALEVSRKWSCARVQWGQPIGKHEAIAHKLADMAAATFAMESVADLAAAMADREGYDIRLEAAVAKEWNTVRGWQITDDALEIRGGRGYESERSLAARGEVPVGIERMMRDSRVNRIFEGSSEIMHLFVAREAVDRHLAVAGALIDPAKGLREKIAALPRIIAFYVVWYPSLWFGWARWPRYRAFGPLAGHLRFVERSSRKLARSIFHGMLVHKAALERRQAFLFRVVDIAMELFAMTAAVCRAQGTSERESVADARRLADLVCRNGRRTVGERFRGLWHNDDVFKSGVGRHVLDGGDAWLEKGAIGLQATIEDLRPVVELHEVGEDSLTMRSASASSSRARAAAVDHPSAGGRSTGRPVT
ncbi:MAG: acyl-CoA dehydrogenase family protein [Polyangiaceae bacterium]